MSVCHDDYVCHDDSFVRLNHLIYNRVYVICSQVSLAIGILISMTFEQINLSLPPPTLSAIIYFVCPCKAGFTVNQHLINSFFAALGLLLVLQIKEIYINENS